MLMLRKLQSSQEGGTDLELAESHSHLNEIVSSNVSSVEHPIHDGRSDNNGVQEAKRADAHVGESAHSSRIPPQCCGWFKMLDRANDAWTVSSSLLDICTDVLVAIEFYRNNHMVFFWSSVSIFIAAQLAYAFLFTGTYAASHSAGGKLVVFLAILPFGQLIPIFAWLESFRFRAVDACLEKLSLAPTGKAKGSAEAAADTRDSDGLWSFIQKKYTAHAGFLAEAFVEAIPQGILQLVAVLVLSDSSGVNVLSILMSISVVASKGYLVAFSLHRPTLVFNFLTITADAFNLFASATWLFVPDDHAGGRGGGDDGAGRTQSIQEADPLSEHPFYVWPLFVGLGSGAVGSFFAVVFMVCDDHLKELYPVIYDGGVLGEGEQVFFDLYVVRVLAWALGLLPMAVAYTTAKLSLLPVLCFQSLDPEQAIHSTFYRPLFQFVGGFVGHERVLPHFCYSFLSLSTLLPSFGSSSAEIALLPLPTDVQKTSQMVNPLEHATHFHDNTRLGALDRQLRLEVTNRFLLEARLHANVLEEQLKGLPDSATVTNAVVPRHDDASFDAHDILREWWRRLDTTHSTLTSKDLEARNKKAAHAILARMRAKAGLAPRPLGDEPHLQMLNNAHMLVEEDELQAIRTAVERFGMSSLTATRSEILRHVFISPPPRMPSTPAPTGHAGASNDCDGDHEQQSSNGDERAIDQRSWCCWGSGRRVGVGVQLFTEARLAWDPDDHRWFLDETMRYVHSQHAWVRDHTKGRWSLVRGTGALANCCYLLGGRNRRKQGFPTTMEYFAPNKGYAERRRVACLRFLVRFVGLLSLGCGVFAACVFLPATLFFAVYSLLYPVTQLPRCFNADSGSDDSGSLEEDRGRLLLLPCVLSWGYLGCLVALAVLAPSVWRFQRLRSQVRDSRGFPECFYVSEAVAEVYTRYRSALGRVETMRAMHNKVGRFNAVEIFSYLEESSRIQAYK